MSSTTSATVSPAAAPTPNKVATVADKDTLVVSTPAPLSPKDERAFEHDRQRVKKAADLVKMRARKGQSRWAALAKGELYNSSRKITPPPVSEKQKRLRADEVDALDGLLGDNGTDVDGVRVMRCFTAIGGETVGSRNLPQVAQGLGYVRVTSSSVPHRSVIVLDDIVSHELLVDEPWEHIYGSDEEESAATTPTKGRSYAEILAANTK
ncbi:hypothetical protein B0H16DRAFT_1446739 [Mycena metata]|uniref:Uncharacterized protein n=1 Tax=Mycena metata TaxID=1033252 RepID=A0AAD7KFN5_9AGAR|nr:hypothetical protein B0H16DRAFT_1446739 [Mycena metata]